MTRTTISRHRVHAQHISRPQFLHAGEVVFWLGAIQAQDQASAEWSIGVRAPGMIQAAVEQAIAERAIVRTWALRSTLHLVSASDVHWLLELLAPSLRTRFAPIYRELELDDETLLKSYTILTKAMQGGKQLIRKEISAAFEQAAMPMELRRLRIVLNRAAIDKIICLGVKRGKQESYTLLDEWIPSTNAGTRKLARDEALAELALRYFSSHGPATLQDFAWWTGLSVTDARAALAMAAPQLAEEKIEGRSYWYSPATLSDFGTQKPGTGAYLLPGFDELILGYTDRTASLDATHTKAVIGVNGIFAYTMVWDGQVVGTWKRSFNKGSVVVALSPFTPLPPAAAAEFAGAAQRYADFLGMPLVL